MSTATMTAEPAASAAGAGESKKARHRAGWGRWAHRTTACPASDRRAAAGNKRGPEGRRGTPDGLIRRAEKSIKFRRVAATTKTNGRTDGLTAAAYRQSVDTTTSAAETAARARHEALDICPPPLKLCSIPIPNRTLNPS